MTLGGAVLGGVTIGKAVRMPWCWVYPGWALIYISLTPLFAGRHDVRRQREEGKKMWWSEDEVVQVAV